MTGTDQRDTGPADAPQRFPRPSPHADTAKSPSDPDATGSADAADDFYLPIGESPEDITRLNATTIRLERPLARGGMGEVWTAHQSSLSREVAVKRPLTDEYLEFVREAKTSAALDHPNIVPVYDLIPSDPPQLVMKLVRGRSWLSAIVSDRDHRRRLDGDKLAKHLRILQDVCQAVGFAHHRGVLHRDLKPAQVMLGDFGESYLMDWGLASGLDGSVLYSTENEFDWRCGTPSYMAPEQASDKYIGLGRATDVYLLGAILYDLLTGQPPHYAGTALMALGRAMSNEFDPIPGDVPAELRALTLRCLSTDPKARPSSALVVRDALRDIESGAAQRSESSSMADKALIEWDDLKKGAPKLDALAIHDRESSLDDTLTEALRRWPENALARQLQASLLAWQTHRATQHGELLLASLRLAEYRRAITGGAGLSDERPDPAVLVEKLEEAKSLARARDMQRRVSLIASIVLVVALLAGAGWWARSERRRATVERELREQAEDQRVEAQRQKAQAERNLGMARAQGDGAQKLIGFILVELRAAMEMELSADRGLTVDKAREIAHAVAGRVATPIVAFYGDMETSSWPEDLQEQHAEHMLTVGRQFGFLARYQEGLALTSNSLQIIQRTAGPGSRYAATAHVELSKLYAQSDQLQEATAQAYAGLELVGSNPDATWEDVALSNIQLANVLLAKGNFAEARERVIRAVSVAEENERPAGMITAKSLNLRGMIEDAQGDSEGALESNIRALAITEALFGARSPESVAVRSSVGSLLEQLDRLAEAKQIATENLEITLEVHGLNHPATATAYNNLGIVNHRLSDFGEAKVCFEKALEISEKILGPVHSETADVLNNLARLSIALGDIDNAIKYSKRAMEIAQTVFGEESPKTATYFNGYAAILSATTDQEGSMRAYREAIRINESVYGKDHPSTATSLVLLANVLLGQNEVGEAQEMIERALAIYDKSFSGDSQEVAHALSDLGMAYYQRQEYEESEKLLKRALEMHTRVAGDHSVEVYQGQRLLGILYSAMDRPDEARVLLQSAIGGSEEIWGPDHMTVAQGLSHLAVLERRQGHPEVALPLMERGLTIMKKTLGEDQPEVGHMTRRLGQVYMDMGEDAKGIAMFEVALGISEATDGPDHAATIAAKANLGKAWLKIGELEKAEEMLSDAVDRQMAHHYEDPTNTSREEWIGIILTELAMCQHRRNKHREALDSAAKALRCLKSSNSRDRGAIAVAENILAGRHPDQAEGEPDPVTGADTRATTETLTASAP